MEHQFVKIGKVGKAHGLMGFFVLVGRDEKLEFHPKTVRIGQNPETLPNHSVAGIKAIDSLKVCLKLDQFDLNSLKSILHHDVWVHRSELPKLSDEEVFLSDLNNKELFGACGTSIGIIESAFQRIGQIPVIVVVSLDGKKDLEIPFSDLYFNLGQIDLAQASSLKMLVSASTFDEIWNARKSR